MLRLLGRRNADHPVSRARHLPRRPARPRPSAPHRARRSRDRGLGRAARGPAPLPRRRRTARRGRATSTSTPSGASRRATRSTSQSSSRTARTRYPARSGTSCWRGSRSSAHRRPPSSRRRRSHHPRSMRRSCSRCAARRSTPSTSASRAAFSTPTAAASHSGTSSRARPWRSRCRLPGDLRCTARCCWRSRTRLVRTPTWHASRITPRRRPTARPCFGSHRRLPSRRRGPVRTARQRPSTRAPSASAATSRPATARTLLEGRSRACYLADDQTEAIEVIREAIRCRQAEGAPLEEARALTELTDYLWCRGYNGEADETVDARVATRCGASRATRARVRLPHAGPSGPVPRRRRRVRRARPPCARDRRALRRRAHRRPCAGHDRQRYGTQRPRARPAADRGGRRDRAAERRARGRRTRHERPRPPSHAVEPPRPRRAVHRRRDRVLHRAHAGPVAHQRPGGRSPLGPRSRSLGRRGPVMPAR